MGRMKALYKVHKDSFEVHKDTPGGRGDRAESTESAVKLFP